MNRIMKRKNEQKRRKKNKKRKLTKSGSSGYKRQRLSDDTSEIGESKSEPSPETFGGETKESEALPVIPLPVITKRPKKKAKPKRPIGTEFINFTCELDKDNCILDQNGLCIAHKTPAGNPKVGVLGQCR